MTVKIITMKDTVELMYFSDYIRQHENAHFLQDPLWSRVKDHWDWQGILLYNESNLIVGAVSSLYRSLPLGYNLVYAPRGPVCDRNDPVVMDILLASLKDCAKKRNALLVYIDPDTPDACGSFRGIMKNHGFSEMESTAFGNIQPQYVFRLPIAGQDECTVLARFSQKTRYNIRLAERRGVKVRRYLGNQQIPEPELESFSDLMETTGKRDHFITRDKEYFRRLLNAFGKDAALFMASVNGTSVAGTIGIFYGNKAWYLYGASANEHRDCMPNYLLQWEMIRYARQCGCILYDFRGVPGDLSQEDPLYGLYRFKKGFNGEYRKFTGLFVCMLRPILARLFLSAFSLFRKLRRYMRK